MEKRTSPLTVLLEPSVHDMVRRAYQNVSSGVHDLIIQDMVRLGYMAPLRTELASATEADADTIPEMHNLPDS